MTGPDHYHEADEIITPVLTGNYDTSKYSNTDLLAMAQVHATLAAAAATAVSSPVDVQAWADVAGTKLSDPG